MFAYVITNLNNGKRYVGITTRRNPVARWDAHKREARKSSPSQRIARAIKAYGEEAFSFEVVACVMPTADTAADRAALCELERILISQYATFGRCGYNATAGGDGSFGRKMSSAELARHIAIRRGRVQTPEQRAKTSAALRESYRLNPALRWRQNRPDHLARMTAASKAKWQDLDYCARRATIQSARIIRDETREKIRKIKTGVRYDAQARENMSAAARLREATRRERDPIGYAAECKRRGEASQKRREHIDARRVRFVVQRSGNGSGKRYLSPETLERMAAAKRGVKNPMFGKIRSQSASAKILVHKEAASHASVP